MQFKNNIRELADLYDYFIFDIWGVIHDGSTAYKGVAEAISFLRAKNKKICFLSNAPRRAHKVAAVLKNFGITSDLYDFILTSGEAAYLDFAKNAQENFVNFGRNYFYIGPEKDIDLLQGLDYKMVTDAALASVAITTGFDNDNSVLEEKMPQLFEAKKFNLPLVCVNPDLIVVKQNGSELICAGALALEYKKMDGRVLYYGKPFPKVYEMVCEMFDCLKSDKIIAVGDGMETDIKGAVDFGIDCALVTGGILSKQLAIKYGEVADKNKVETICKNYQIFPKFVIPSL
ncbi:MAG: TIGR01459 family HAD-type hydrolase [Proteobacteria bacterium]|nr:TIGR01459 family HAD-type hydrolase [Pseudomonadota bacterium]